MDGMKFIHLRNHTTEGQVLPKGGATIGYWREDDLVLYTTSKCCENDHFNKAVGRLKCEKKALSERRIQALRVPANATNRMVCAQLIEHHKESIPDNDKFRHLKQLQY